MTSEVLPKKKKRTHSQYKNKYYFLLLLELCHMSLDCILRHQFSFNFQNPEVVVVVVAIVVFYSLNVASN